jgi:outer membrane protein OmpA-like peptidoglycan-associated protein
MRLTSTLAVGASFWLAASGVASAQSVQNGLDVQVNPYAARGGSQTLLYPGGEYSRNVSPLLYPGERNGPIRLHMPGPHRHVARAKNPDLAQAEAPPAPKPKKVARVAKAEPAPATPAQPSPADVGGYQNPFGGPADYGNVFGGKPAAKPAPAPKPVQTAKATPAPAQTPTGNDTAGLAKRSVILFAKDASDPASGALGAIKFLAGSLNAEMTGPGSRVELQAFGGNKGDKGSDARRLSLKRALAIRQVLIDDGVSPDRIDVRAMGGADDSGPADRVDVFVRA